MHEGEGMQLGFTTDPYFPASGHSNAYDALRDYLVYGGMPYLLTYNREEDKANYLKSLFRKVYLTDIMERYIIRNDGDMEELVNIVASSIGSLTNPKNLSNAFKSVKHSTLSETTIKNYLEMLENAFMIEKTMRYDIKGKRYISTPVKYYFEDLGLRNALLDFRQIDEGHLMENLIYNELRMRGYSVDAGRVEVFDKNDEGKTIRKTLEADFVCNLGAKRCYIRSALEMAHTRESEAGEQFPAQAQRQFSKDNHRQWSDTFQHQ